MRASWLRPSLLLLLAVLALAGTGGGPRHGWQTEPGVAPIGAAPDGWIGGPTAPEQPALLGAGAPAIAHALRDAGEGPVPGGAKATSPHPHVASGTHPPAAALRLRVAAQLRLGFAHGLELRSSGAISSFGTTLPPPLLV